jgi:hypothetical protein
MSQDVLIAQHVLLSPALAELVRSRRGRTVSTTALRLLLRSAETSRGSGGKKLLSRELAELFAWLPVGTSVVVNANDGRWIAGAEGCDVLDKFVELYGKVTPGHMFTVGRPTHAGGGLCSK